MIPLRVMPPASARQHVGLGRRIGAWCGRSSRPRQTDECRQTGAWQSALKRRDSWGIAFLPLDIVAVAARWRQLKELSGTITTPLKPMECCGPCGFSRSLAPYLSRSTRLRDEIPRTL